MKSIKVYIYNKILSFSAVFACILGTFLYFGFSIKQWQTILLAIIVLGYSHFLLGFYYQLKSFHRLDRPWQSYLTFILLCVFSVLIAKGVLEYFGFIAALFFGFIYFLLHGLFNEQTLIFRQTGFKVPLITLVPLAIFIMSLLIYSVPDQTFFFDSHLQFKNINEFTINYTFENYYMSLSHFTSVFWVGFASSVAILLFAWIRKGFGKLSLFLGISMALISILVYRFGPPAYIYMYLFVVGYHFMTWLLFYLVEMKRRGNKQYRKFILQNAAIFIPLLAAACLFMNPYTPNWVYAVFNYELFVIATYIHISTSFMNDEWLKKMQAKVFSSFGLSD